MPTGSRRKNGIDAEATYDMFIHGSDTDEVMVYYAGGTKSFVLEKNETKGTIDYLAILRWLHAHHALTTRSPRRTPCGSSTSAGKSATPAERHAPSRSAA